MNAGRAIARSGVYLALLAGVVVLSLVSAARGQLLSGPAPAADTGASASAPLVQPDKYDGQAINRPGASSSPKSNGAAITSPGTLSFGRIWVALAIVIAIILVLQWLSRRFFGGQGMHGSLKAVRILGRAPVSPKQQLVLIQFGRRLVLAANSGSQMSTLSELSDPDEVAALLGQLRQEKGETPGAFAGLFKRANKEFDADTNARPADADAAPALHDKALGASLSSTQEELSGLMEKIRRMSART